MRYPRDMRGYGPLPPSADWPGGARIALQFVLNYEEGGENCVLHGDSASEAFLSEIVGAAPWPGARHWNMESIYEYGARAGFWRLHRLFTARRLPVTVFGVATALLRGPEQVAAMREADWEIASHGRKWIEHKDFTISEERLDIAETARLHAAATGASAVGWYSGRCSAQTLDLLAEREELAYVSDAYADDLPYWRQPLLPGATEAAPRPAQLVLPYTLDANDMRFATAQGFNAGDQFYAYLKDSFDLLYAEGAAGAPKMMSVGLHCRLVGRPGRAAALERFLDYALSHEKVWCARRIDIARHWMDRHPPALSHDAPSRLSRADFVAKFGGVYEHSPFIAERAYSAGVGGAHDHALGLNAALRAAFRLASDEERLEVLRAHPDLAGKLAAAKRLTAESSAEQASAGLDALTDEERARFTTLNDSYTQKFGFPFIIAVRGLDKAAILQAFETRIAHERAVEFETACAQVERIAALRISQIFGDDAFADRVFAGKAV